MNVPIPPLKHLQPAQYVSWLRRATDPEWDEEHFGCSSRSKAERAAASFALELSEAFERIAALTEERGRQVKVLRDALEEIMDRAEWFDPIAYEIASKALKEIE